MNPEHAFELEIVQIPLDQILPIRQVSANILTTGRGKTIRTSVEDIGIIEPLVVRKVARREYTLLDGHVRLVALRDLGHETAPCLLARDDEALTYNRSVNRIPPIQEHRMIARAIKNGVPVERIAAALSLDPRTVEDKKRLLNGICDEAAEVLKRARISKRALNFMKAVKPLRQIEMAELMVAADNYTSGYVQALVMGTPADQQVKPPKETKRVRMDPAKIAKMEEEVQRVGREFVRLEETYGRDVLDLVLLRGYLHRLLENGKIVGYLAANHPDMLRELQTVAEAKTLET